MAISFGRLTKFFTSNGFMHYSLLVWRLLKFLILVGGQVVILKITHTGMEPKVSMKLAVLALQLNHATGSYVYICYSTEMGFKRLWK